MLMQMFHRQTGQHFLEFARPWCGGEVLPPGCSGEDVVRLGLRIEKILASQEDPGGSMKGHLERYPADLLVLMTHQYDLWNAGSQSQSQNRLHGIQVPQVRLSRPVLKVLLAWTKAQSDCSIS
ncbi:MAG: hypothetical protein C4293_08360 [Nitrospiraceae bacterium]